MSIDISNYTFDEWLSFTFEHDGYGGFWYLEDEWDYESDHRKVILYMTRLFRNPCILLKKFSVQQIDLGFWFIPSPAGYMGFLLDE